MSLERCGYSASSKRWYPVFQVFKQSSQIISSGLITLSATALNVFLVKQFFEKDLKDNKEHEDINIFERLTFILNSNIPNDTLSALCISTFWNAYPNSEINLEDFHDEEGYLSGQVFLLRQLIPIMRLFKSTKVINLTVLLESPWGYFWLFETFSRI